jgi:predicted anti-sigma-YlaC factor YlaD
MSCKSEFTTLSFRLLATPIFFIAAFYALIQSSWWPLIVAALIPVFGSFLALLIASQPVTVAEARRVRKFQYFVYIFFAVAIIYIAITGL